MPHNLELKASVSSLKEAGAIALTIGSRPAGQSRQVDTYYDIPNGRLKLREINSQKGELIYYSRPNRLGGRYSRYLILPVKDIPAVKRSMSLMLKRTIEVRKTRRLFLYKDARIHLDSVRGLGRFIEFEVLVTRGRPQAARLLRFLRTIFMIRPQEIIGFSYSDLLLKKSRRSFPSRT